MKGIVFTEFLEMVEDKFGIVVLDKVIEHSQLSTKGIYSAVGNYQSHELIEMVKELSHETKVSSSDLLITYGEHMFKYFTKRYFNLFEGIEDPLDFLEKVDQYIHVEVQKLYPDAELPKFEIEERGPNFLIMTYISHRKLSDFAHGLVNGCADYYGVDFSVTKTDLLGDGTKVRFSISLDSVSA